MKNSHQIQEEVIVIEENNNQVDNNSLSLDRERLSPQPFFFHPQTYAILDENSTDTVGCSINLGKLPLNQNARPEDALILALYNELHGEALERLAEVFGNNNIDSTQAKTNATTLFNAIIKMSQRKDRIILLSRGDKYEFFCSICDSFDAICKKFNLISIFFCNYNPKSSKYKQTISLTKKKLTEHVNDKYSDFIFYTHEQGGQTSCLTKVVAYSREEAEIFCEPCCLMPCNCFS